MSVSKLSVCNSALVKVGADRISSITQDVKRATLLNAVYDEVRDAVLRAHPWNFAVVRASLTPTSTTPEFGYDFQYDEPNDCLRLLNVYVDDSDDIDWVSEQRKILTDESAIDVKYIFRQDDESEWDACFAEAMAWRLAKEVAYNLTQSVTLAQMCEKEYGMVLAEARSMDGSEGVPPPVEIDTWTLARKR